MDGLENADGARDRNGVCRGQHHAARCRTQLIDSGQSVTNKPITTDSSIHTPTSTTTGATPSFPATVEFVAHEGTRANMARAKCQPVTNCDAFKGENAKYLPKRTYKDD